MTTPASVTIGTTTVSVAQPAIFASVFARTPDQVSHLVATDFQAVDVVEWRVDHDDMIRQSCQCPSHGDSPLDPAAPSDATNAADPTAGTTSPSANTLAPQLNEYCADQTERIRQATARSVLATLRTSVDGSDLVVSDDHYLTCIAHLAASADAVDVELSRPNAAAAIDLAHEAGCPVIGSYHYWTRVPDRVELIKTLAQARLTGVEIIKIAVQLRSMLDAHQLAETAWTLSHTEFNTPMMVMGMGMWGRYSRIFAPDLGSCGTFGYCPATAANDIVAGQVSAEVLRQVWNEHHPTQQRSH